MSRSGRICFLVVHYPAGDGTADVHGERASHPVAKVVDDWISEAPDSLPARIVRSGTEGVETPRKLRHTFASITSESSVAGEEITRLTRNFTHPTTETIYPH